MKQFILLLFSIALLVGCEPKEVMYVEPKVDYSYFPLQEGLFREYQVTFIAIDAPSNVYDTSSYYLKEVYGSYFDTPSGDSMIRLERFIKDEIDQNYELAEVWSAYYQDNGAFTVEDNITFVKLKFPLRLEMSWDENAYNRMDTLQEYQSTITSLDVPVQLNDLTFDSTLQVTQRQKLSIVDKIDFFEMYASGIGLIQMQKIDIYSEDVDPQIPIEQRITRGTMYQQKIISYGKN